MPNQLDDVGFTTASPLLAWIELGLAWALFIKRRADAPLQENQREFLRGSIAELIRWEQKVGHAAAVQWFREHSTRSPEFDAWVHSTFGYPIDFNAGLNKI